jgi:hypothetical protein
MEEGWFNLVEGVQSKARWRETLDGVHFRTCLLFVLTVLWIHYTYCEY